MNQDYIRDLHKLSRWEKLEVVQLLWDDIAREQEMLDVPDEHRKILDERLRLIKEDRASYNRWDELKKKYLEI